MTSHEPAQPVRMHDAEVELALVGAALLFGDDALREAAPIVGAEDFFDPARGAAFGLLVRGHEDARPHDAVSLVTALVDSKTFPDRTTAQDLVVRAQDACPSGANVGRHARRVRELAGRRRLAAFGDSVKMAALDGQPVAEAITAAREGLDALEGTDDPEGCLLLPLAEAMRVEVAERAPLVGAHLLDRGGLGFIVSEEGLGKTYLSLALALDLARGGGSWLGLSLPEEPVRVLYGWGEGGLARFQDRMEILLAGETVPETFRVMVPKERAPDLATPEGLARVGRAIEDHRADLFIPDTLSEWSSHDENDTKASKEFFRGINALRRRTGCALTIPHHSRKSGEHSSRGSAREARGSTTLPGTADFVLVLDRDRDRVLASWGKIRNAAPHPALVLQFDAGSGRFVVLGEKAVRVRGVSCARETIRKALQDAGGKPRTYEAIQRDTGLSRRTLERNLPEMVAAGEVEETSGAGLLAAFNIPPEGLA